MKNIIHDPCHPDQAYAARRLREAKKATDCFWCSEPELHVSPKYGSQEWQKQQVENQRRVAAIMKRMTKEQKAALDTILSERNRRIKNARRQVRRTTGQYDSELSWLEGEVECEIIAREASCQVRELLGKLTEQV